MELVQELLLTAIAAVVFSFVVAKLVSMAVGGDGERELGLKSNESACGEGERVVDELKFGGGLRVQSVESARNFQSVEEAVKMIDEFGCERSVDKSEELLCTEEFEEKRCGASGRIEVGDLSEKSSEGRLQEKERVAAIIGGTEVDGIEKDHAVTNLGELVVERGSERTEEDEIDDVDEGSEMTGLVVEEKIVVNAKENNKIVDEDAEIRDVGSGEKQGSGIERGLNKGDEMKGSLVSDEDDDWEGIEKSELAETFARAANFVSGGGDDDRLLNVGNDVQMQLCALHKVAMEGPCHEPQPMALKVSARAKWNAWQRLGNMNPEVAMEQYITLLSDKVPGWMEGKSSGDHNADSSKSGILISPHPDITTYPHNRLSSTNLTELELNSGADDGGDLIGGSDSVNKE